MYSTSLSPQFVTENAVLGDQYLLKAGSIIQILAVVSHQDPQISGQNAAIFDAAHFCPQIPAAAFRAFGGGSTLCPSRMLTTTEIFTFISMFILLLDAGPADDGATWSLLKPRFVNMTTLVMTLPEDMRVKVTK